MVRATSRRVGAAALAVSTLAGASALAATEPAEAKVRSFPTGKGWKQPTRSSLYEDWGFKDCSSEYASEFRKAHLGADSRRPNEAGYRVNAIGSGTVQRVVSWGSQWGRAVSVRHKTANGKSFLAIYGHITPSVRQGEKVKTGMRLGELADIRSSEGKSLAHLHLGIRRLGKGIDPKDHPRGQWPCDDSNRAPEFAGYVDPIPYLASHAPPSDKPPSEPPEPPSEPPEPPSEPPDPPSEPPEPPSEPPSPPSEPPESLEPTGSEPDGTGPPVETGVVSEGANGQAVALGLLGLGGVVTGGLMSRRRLNR